MFWPHTLHFCYKELAFSGVEGVGWGVMTFVVDCKQERCFRWMTFLETFKYLTRGGGGWRGGVMTFVVDCKQERCRCCLHDVPRKI